MLKSMRWHKVSDYRGYLDRRTASDAKRLDAWLEKTGADLYTYESPIDLTRYLQGEWRGCRHYNPERPPCTDHARLFKNSKTGKAWFVSQPYDSPQEAMRQVLPCMEPHRRELASSRQRSNREICQEAHEKERRRREAERRVASESKQV